MTLTTAIDAQTPRSFLLPLTVKQYHRMIETGILEEGSPFELLDGLIMRKDRSAAGEDPRTIGNEHVWVVKSLMELNPRLQRLGCHMQAQQPVVLPPNNEPEPDGAIVRGTKDDYQRRKPGAADVPCIIEVADSSLRLDRARKLAIYAQAGIPQYVIINLPDRIIEVYTGPGKGRYAQMQTISRRQSVEFNVGGGKVLRVAAKSVLPSV